MLETSTEIRLLINGGSSSAALANVGDSSDMLVIVGVSSSKLVMVAIMVCAIPELDVTARLSESVDKATTSKADEEEVSTKLDRDPETLKPAVVDCCNRSEDDGICSATSVDVGASSSTLLMVALVICMEVELDVTMGLSMSVGRTAESMVDGETTTPKLDRDPERLKSAVVDCCNRSEDEEL